MIVGPVADHPVVLTPPPGVGAPRCAGYPLLLNCNG